MKDTEVVVLDDFKYESMKKMIKSYRADMMVDDMAFCFIDHKSRKSFIVLHDNINKYGESFKKVVIAHELAHIHGVMDEEDADRWALENVKGKKEKEILLGNWKVRHGHEYKK